MIGDVHRDPENKSEVVAVGKEMEHARMAAYRAGPNGRVSAP